MTAEYCVPCRTARWQARKDRERQRREDAGKDETIAKQSKTIDQLGEAVQSQSAEIKRLHAVLDSRSARRLRRKPDKPRLFGRKKKN
jgi:hypothetical protein